MLANLASLSAETRFPLLHVAFSTLSVFETGWDGEGGLKGWQRHQLANENEPMTPGPAFDVFERLLELNTHSPDPRAKPLVHVHVVSRQNHVTSLRFAHSLEHHGLTKHAGVGLHQFSYLNGANPIETLLTLGAHLYLSADRRSVRQALRKGIAAAHVAAASGPRDGAQSDKLKIAFDGDAVIFDDEAERIFQEHGLEAFLAHEQAKARIPLAPGPLHGFLLAVKAIRSLFPEQPDSSPLNLVLATARSFPAHERATRTLRFWDIVFDRADFMSGREKGPLLQAMGATIFFDDSASHVESARRHGVPAGHVPWGVKNP